MQWLILDPQHLLSVRLFFVFLGIGISFLAVHWYKVSDFFVVVCEPTLNINPASEGRYKDRAKHNEQAHKHLTGLFIQVAEKTDQYQAKTNINVGHLYTTQKG